MKAVPLKRYKSVSIVCPKKCCAAIKAVAGKRFLACDVPSLPLRECTQSNQCSCNFKKHEDRRDDERRFVGTMSLLYAGAEKRKPRGRRQTD